MNNIIINLNNIYIYSLRFGSNLVAFPNKQLVNYNEVNITKF